MGMCRIRGRGLVFLALSVCSLAAAAQGDSLLADAQRRVDAFAAWTATFEPARADAAIIAEGLRLAGERREAMKLLIVDDPAAALAAALPHASRARLPDEITALLEQRIDAYGMLTERVTMFHDHPPGHESHDDGDFHRSVRTPVVVVGEKVWEAFTFGRRVGVRSLQPLPVHGIAIDGDLAFGELPFRTLDAGEAPAGLSAPEPRTCAAGARLSAAQQRIANGDRMLVVCDPDELEAISQHWGVIEREGTDGRFIAPKAETHSSYTTGPKTFLYIRARFADQAETALPSLATVTGTVNSMRDHMRAFSYNLIPDITGTFTDVVVLPRTAAEYGTNDIPILSDAANAALAANPAWNRSNYSFYAVRFVGGPGGYAGQAYVGTTGIWMKSDSGGVAAHELGHNLGLLHANFWTTASFDPAGAGSNSEYGNPFDRLGSGGGLASHFTASFKERISWLLDPQFARLWGSGSHRLVSQDIAAPLAGLAMAGMFGRERLWLPSLASSEAVPASAPVVQRGHYWLEHRSQYTQFDRALHVNLQGSANYLLDLTPRSRDGKNDGGLLIGRTHSDPGLGLHVTPVAKSTGTPPFIDYVVRTGGFAGNGAPSVALSASATSVAVNTPVNFTATASDPDGDALAYAWEWGDGTFAGTNAATSSRSFASAGHYVVRVVASDMKGARASARVLVTVGAPTTLRASGRVLAGGLPVEGVHVNNGQSGGNYRGTYTDSSGQWTITGLASGAAVTLSAGASGYSLAPAFTNPLTPTADVGSLDFTATALPVVSIVATDASATETPSDTLVYRLARTGPVTAMLRVWFERTGTAFSSGTSGDYSWTTGANRYVEIPAGQAFVDLVATPVTDTIAEPGETVVVDLVDGVDYELAWPARAQGLIAGTAGPPNDHFANATAITGTTATVNGSNANATLEFLEPPHNGRNGSGLSAWWRWTAPQSGPVVIDTVGSALDTLLAVYSGNTLGELVPVAANNNQAAGVTTSRVAFLALAGVTYRIAVSLPSTGGVGGNVRVNLALDTSDADVLFRNGYEP
jgi:hypothetical protein